MNLTEQVLGACAYGPLVMCFPITSGDEADPARRTPDGLFRVNAYDRLHTSSLYDPAERDQPYPMHDGVRFFITSQGVAVWIHGRDVPGYAASHGCIGLYDEPMQKEYYGYPRRPVLQDARTLDEWAIAPHPDDGHFHQPSDGPVVQIIGPAPVCAPRTAAGTDARSRPPGRTARHGGARDFLPGEGRWRTAGTLY